MRTNLVLYVLNDGTISGAQKRIRKKLHKKSYYFCTKVPDPWDLRNELSVGSLKSKVTLALVDPLHNVTTSSPTMRQHHTK